MLLELIIENIPKYFALQDIKKLIDTNSVMKDSFKSKNIYLLTYVACS